MGTWVETIPLSREQWHDLQFMRTRRKEAASLNWWA